MTSEAHHTKLILVRHGETTDNAARTPRGQGQGTLTELGWAQARAVGERLSGYDFAQLYCSDLNRAVQTASAIAAATGHEIKQEPGFRERHFGQFEGIPWIEIEHQYPAELARYRSGDPDYVVPGGESTRQLHQRSVQCLRDIARRHAGETIVVVTHGGVIHSFFREVLGIPQETQRCFNAENASISTFVSNADGWLLVVFGDTCHLPSGAPLMSSGQ